MQRSTTSDDVFKQLHADIVSLKLKPGERLSEVDVAKQFEISRQPVREAFIRLRDLDLLRIQPQRATEVRLISKRALLNARFIRTAVEIEVLRVACHRDTASFEQAFDQNLRLQRAAIDADDAPGFHALDYEFHHLICKAADLEFTYETLAANKAKIDRLCLLGLTREAEMTQVLGDHVALADHIRMGQEVLASTLIRQHLSRVINLLDGVRNAHPEYFIDD